MTKQVVALGNTGTQLVNKLANNFDELYGAIQSLNSIAALRLTTGTVGATAEVLGYYSSADGGGGTFRWDEGSVAADNGGTVILPTGRVGPGRWIRVYTGEIYAIWFGVLANGISDDSNALDAAYGAMASGDTLILPKGNIGITRTFGIGNGSASNISTIQAIAFKGGSTRGITGWVSDLSLDPTGQTILKWVGAANAGPMVNLLGPIAVYFDGISLDGNNLVEAGLLTNHIWHSTISNLDIKRYTRKGMEMLAYHNAEDPSLPVGVYGRLVSAGSGANRVSNVAINSFGDGLAKDCLLVGNNSVLPVANFNHSLNQTLFENVSTLANGHSSSRATVLRFCDNNMFERCYMFAPPRTVGPPGNPYGLVFEAPNVPGAPEEYLKAFPGNNSFANCSISSEKSSNGWLGGGQGGTGSFFVAMSKERQASAGRGPTVYGVNGFTDRGAYFGRNQIPIEDFDTASVDERDQVYHSPSVIYRNTASVIKSNTAAAETVYGCKIKADLLGFKCNTYNALTTTYDRILNTKSWGSILNNTGSNKTFRVQLILDGVTSIASTTFTLPTSAFYRTVRCEWDIIARSQSVQTCVSNVTISDGFDNNPCPVAFNYQDFVDMTIDAAVDHQLTMVITMETASASMIYAGSGLIATLE